MKRLTLTLLSLVLFAVTGLEAQTADEIIANYFENTGGYDNWGKLKGMKMTASLNQGGTILPLEIVTLIDGRQYAKIDFQGQELWQGVSDGEVIWNQMPPTMTPEKVDTETAANMMLGFNDFPDPFYNYKEKGYTVELMGTETIEGAETYKVKLITEPVTIDGVEMESVSFYYFDTENFVPIANESEVLYGPQKGIVSFNTFSDYQEVDGLYFPFSISQGIKDGPSQPINFDTIELNPEVDDSVFKFPGN